MARARVGTSGWSYPEWVGRFYPIGTSTSRMLPFYASQFLSVELHSTYRTLPSTTAIERWSQCVPPNFCFSPKAHLGITHRRELEGLAERTNAFVESIALLGDHLGPILLALPHQAVDLARLDALLAALPSGPRYAFQLHSGWVVPQVLDRLDAHGSTLVVVDAEGPPPRPLSVGPFDYIRLRRDRYDRAELQSWAERMGKSLASGRDVYLFVKHDEVANGPRYAREVNKALARV